MASEKAMISFCATIVFGALISGGLAEVSCPKRVMIEKGGTATVSCEVTDANVAEVYWYKGDPALSSPILQWVNGQRGGTELQKGHYNISNTGGMIITNATIIHEAVYTTFMYFSDDTSDSKAVMINITISPWPPRPIIDACTSYEECSLVVNDTGKLTCNIRRSRPWIAIEWIIISKKGISFVEQPPVIVKDSIYDTWNSSVEIVYGAASCNQEARFQCVALDHFNLLEHSSSSVRLYTENCAGDIPVSTKPPTIKILIVVLVIIVVVAAIVVVVCISKKWKRRQSNNDTKLPREALSMIPKTKEVQDSKESQSDKPEITDEEVKKLVMDLKNKYKSSCLFDPLQRNESIKVADLYAGCYCEVRHKNGEISCNSTDKLLTSNVIIKENRVLIDGGSSTGKTMFTKQFVQQWIQSDTNEFILLFVPRQEVKQNTELINLVDMQNRDYLTKVIRTKDCILLLDGLPNIDSQADESSKEEKAKFGPESNDSPSLVNLTLSDVFKRLERKVDSDIQIWVTCSEEDNTENPFSWPYVKVDVKDVRKDQLKDFIKKASRQFANVSWGTLSVHNSTTNYSDTIVRAFSKEASTEDVKISRKTVTQPTKRENVKEKDQLPSSCEQEDEALLSEGVRIKENALQLQPDILLQRMEEFFEETQIYQEFKETPILLSVIIHIAIRDLLAAVDFDDMKTITTEEIVCKLIRRVQNAYFMEQISQDMSKKSSFEDTLSRFALYLVGKEDKPLENQSTSFSEIVKMAIEMSLLQHFRNISDCQELQKKMEPLSTNRMHFSHRYFKYYYVANYIVQYDERYTSVLTNIEESDKKAILKFLVHLEHSSLNHLLKALHVSDMDDDMIDCLHNWKNQDNVKTVVASFNGNEFQIKNLNRSKKHKAAFESFCEKCCQMKVYLKSLSVLGRFPVRFMTSLDIPHTGTFTFSGIEVQESQFLSILKWLSEKDMTLRFLECKMPQTLKDETKEEMKRFHHSKLKTILQPDVKINTTYKFNYKTAKWAKE